MTLSKAMATSPYAPRPRSCCRSYRSPTCQPSSRLPGVSGGTSSCPKSSSSPVASLPLPYSSLATRWVCQSGSGAAGCVPALDPGGAIRLCDFRYKCSSPPTVAWCAVGSAPGPLPVACRSAAGLGVSSSVPPITCTGVCVSYKAGASYTSGATVAPVAVVTTAETPVLATMPTECSAWLQAGAPAIGTPSECGSTSKLAW